jgi:hypothetical protein
MSPPSKATRVRPHRSWRRGAFAMLAIPRFALRAFAEQWHAAPVAMIASVLSTGCAAACASASSHYLTEVLGGPLGIAINSMASVGVAYTGYLAIYYIGMFHVERRSARRRALHDEPVWALQWRRTAWTDYLLHLPSDLSLLAGIATAQGALVGAGVTDPFWAAVCSNLATDVYTTLREPLYWRAAHHFASHGSRPSGAPDQRRD